MSETNLPSPPSADSMPKDVKPSRTFFVRVARYTIFKAIVLFITVVAAVYLTILIANLGGFVDTVISTGIEETLMLRVEGGWLRGVPVEEKFETIRRTKWHMEEAAGLHEPFMVRCFRWLGRGLTLDWGESVLSSSGVPYTAPRDIRLTIMDHLPRTLLMFSTANVFLFFTSVFLALPLTKRYGSWLDRLVVLLSPLSAAPAWICGIILMIILPTKIYDILRPSVRLKLWPDPFTLADAPMMLGHMMLPILAIFLSGLFQSIYAWRTFFLVYAREDYVEMARAKGLPDKMIERHYLLRPVLPSLITSFALLFVGLWQQVIALEFLFDIAGVGKLLVRALWTFNTPVIVSLVVIFAYFLALTVFILDITYALVDPRVSIENKNQAIRITSRKRWGRFCFRLPRKSKSPRAHRRTWAIRSDAPYFTPKRARASFSGQVKALWKRTRDLKPVLREIARYPSAMIGLTIIAIFVAVSLYTVIAIPHGKAIRLWRGDENVWARNPKMAQPEWINFFRKEKLPPTIVLDSRDGASGVVRKSVAPFAEGMNEITLSFPIDFTYSTFPQNLVVYFEAQYDEKMPLLTLTWLTPDGREIELWTSTIIASQEYHLALDKRLQRKLDEHLLERALFGDPNAETSTPLQGTYELRASALVFEEEADLDAEVVLYGQVYGLAGTDDKRRDLMVALLWGVPVALAFGLVAAVGTSVSSMVIAAIGAWFGGWADGLIQRITEVNMILPFFPVSLMIYLMYSKSLWAILGVTVLLSIFGNAIKNYRAIFIQLREAPYIEAAQAYGADNWRIIFRYLIPRIVAVWIPQFVTLVPSYVFLEATLAYLRVSDPVLPTWGKLIHLGRMDGPYHLVPLLIGLLLLIGGAFVLVGLALERMFEPRLREM